MSYDATCHCPKCNKVWWELVHDNELFTCPKCGYKNTEPEELDSDLDEDEKIMLMEYLKKINSKK